MNDGLMDRNKNTTNLFVYGTLMSGQANHGHIQDFVRGARRGMRSSPHVYNTDKEIDQLIDALPKH